MEGIRELEEELAKIRKKGAGKKTASPGKQVSKIDSLFKDTS